MIFILLIAAALWIPPLWMLLPRAGAPSWLALFAIIPLVGFVLLWIAAFRRPRNPHQGVF